MVRSWLVPRRPIHPAWRYGNADYRIFIDLAPLFA
jgi:hypothetical protein